ncbi:MAG: glutamate--tRNA ligase [Dehalococcoidales bacterium]|nr:glutamate--tRNA ligase [Dehalococcoidales bacterium]
MNDEVRVRYAPSPTGYPHVGNIRTALFNWLFARHHGGSFIIRIEDTDVARTVEGAVEAILDGLRWMGIDWDEGPEVGGNYGPYVQSQRLAKYQAAAKRLIDQGDAYYCYCTTERLDEMRNEQTRLKQPPGYDRYCRDLSVPAGVLKWMSGLKRVVRFRTPFANKTTFHDIIRGDVTFENSTIDDFVILKSDGYPTYHLASVVDDHEMGITHVLRAEEWLSSTPRHLLMYKALGYKPPEFAHLPMLLGADRSKLSKRHGSVSIIEYKERGYLPEAMVNFLSLLGWSLDGKTELLTVKDIIKNFSLSRVNQTGAIFNIEKLDWMNGIYIRDLKVDDFSRRVIPFLEKGLPEEVIRPVSLEYVKKIAPLVQERVKKLNEISELTEFFFVDNLKYDSNILVVKKMTRDLTRKVLEASISELGELPVFSEESLETVLRPLADKLEVKTGQLFGTLRSAITGREVAPPLFQTMAVLGKERCVKRLQEALVLLDKVQDKLAEE